MFWGNRGVLHDDQGRLVRYSRARAWLICVLEFKGRRRTLMTPRRLTELFFLDEATGLARGTGRAVSAVAAITRRSNGHSAPVPAGHPRWTPGCMRTGFVQRDHRSYAAVLSALPDGTMVDIGGEPWLVYEGGLLAWTPGGYESRRVAEP